MNANILAVRALSAQFALRILRTTFWVGLAVYVFLIGMSWWLASAISGWWWLLGALVTLGAIIAGVVWLLFFLFVRSLRPSLNATQRKLCASLITQITDIPELASTPKFLLLWYVVRDLYQKTPFSETYIGEVVKKPGQMKRDFEELKGSFVRTQVNSHME